jgi:hypothetical protein
LHHPFFHIGEGSKTALLAGQAKFVQFELPTVDIDFELKKATPKKETKRAQTSSFTFKGEDKKVQSERVTRNIRRAPGAKMALIFSE